MGALYIACFTVTPIASASILTFRRRGSRGLKALLGRIVDFKRITRGRWSVAALLLGPLLSLLSLGGMVSSGAPIPPALTPFVRPLLAQRAVVGGERGRRGPDRQGALVAFHGAAGADLDVIRRALAEPRQRRRGSGALQELPLLGA